MTLVKQRLIFEIKVQIKTSQIKIQGLVKKNLPKEREQVKHLKKLQVLQKERLQLLKFKKLTVKFLPL